MNSQRIKTSRIFDTINFNFEQVVPYYKVNTEKKIQETKTRTSAAGPCLREHSIKFQELKDIRPWAETISACYFHEASPWCETFRWSKKLDC